MSPSIDRGVPIVVSAPSGAGKTTLCRKVMQRLRNVAFSISHTTRAPRPKERADVDYHFVDDDSFAKLVDQGAFLEWAHVHRYRYGTSRTAAERLLSAGCDVFFDVDVQGGAQIAKAMPNAALVLVLPPSLEVLGERLRQRHSDSDEQIETRLAVAAQEIRAASFYTYVLINEDLHEATVALESIVRAERLRNADRQARVNHVLRGV